MNGIIIDGKVYEAVPRDYTCDGCDLRSQCYKLWNRKNIEYCEIHSDYEFKFKLSQSLTNKINY